MITSLALRSGAGPRPSRQLQFGGPWALGAREKLGLIRGLQPTPPQERFARLRGWEQLWAGPAGAVAGEHRLKRGWRGARVSVHVPPSVHACSGWCRARGVCSRVVRCCVWIPVWYVCMYICYVTAGLCRMCVCTQMHTYMLLPTSTYVYHRWGTSMLACLWCG